MKRLFSILCMFCISVPSLAHAAWTGPDTIKNIRQDRSGPNYGTGSTVVRLTNTSCPVGEFVLTGDSDSKNRMLKIALSAYLSGKSVDLSWASSGSTCNVRSIQIGKN